MTTLVSGPSEKYTKKTNRSSYTKNPGTGYCDLAMLPTRLELHGVYTTLGIHPRNLRVASLPPSTLERSLALHLPHQSAICCTMSLTAFAPLAPVQLSRAAPCLRSSRAGTLRARAPTAARVRTRTPTRCAAVTPGVARTLVGVYGVVVAGGGVGAYLRTRSTMSGVSGAVAGAVLATAYATDNVPLAFGTAVALAVVFGVRLAKTKKVMPAGMLLVLSAVFATVFGISVFS